MPFVLFVGGGAAALPPGRRAALMHCLRTAGRHLMGERGWVMPPRPLTSTTGPCVVLSDTPDRAPLRGTTQGCVPRGAAAWLTSSAPSCLRNPTLLGIVARGWNPYRGLGVEDGDLALAIRCGVSPLLGVAGVVTSRAAETMR